MNIVLWATQIVLAIKLLTTTYTHGIRPDRAKMQRGVASLGAARQPLLILIAIAALLGGVGLILPAAIGDLAWLTPWCAAVISAMLLAATGFHLACRDKPNVAVSLVLAALAAFVAYGRWVLAPL